jgi:YegS/Rv2252/BmrU family lipid kinase
MSAFIVVNPRSGGGRTERLWPEIHSGLKTIYPQMRVAMTGARGEAATLVREALDNGHTEIVAVGGDGTINEAINGMFDLNGPRAPQAVFGFITSGTGGDFRKSFGIAAGHAAALARLKEAKPKPIDVGRVTCITQGGGTAVRYFVNIASVGLSGVIVDAVNRAKFAKLFGGQFAFAFHSAISMLTYRNRVIRLKVDREMDEIVTISTLAIANGQFFGGGMRVAPLALPDDGQFDVVLMGDVPKRQALAQMKSIYAGEHLDHPAVRCVRGNKIVAVPVAETGGHPVLVEVDGESAGQLPATFEILPGALNLRC